MSCDRERRDRQRHARRTWEREVAAEERADRQHQQQLRELVSAHPLRDTPACRRWL